VDCRRVLIMQYFGEAFDKGRCKGTCDNCRDARPLETIDLTALARDTIRCVVVTLVCVCVEVLRGGVM
jgi:bloom syndrome protein